MSASGADDTVKEPAARWRLRSRVRRLYGTRRERLLIVPRQVLERRFGADAVASDDDNRWLRVAHDDTIFEVGFAGKFRMFGALIDTQWTARSGTVDLEGPRYDYRFDKKSFHVRSGGSAERARRLADTRTVELAGRSELKRLTVFDGPDGRMVELVPLAGTITAVYFPPMPPYTVVLKESEGEDHLALLFRLLER